MFQNILNTKQGVPQKSNGKVSLKTKNRFISKTQDHSKNQLFHISSDSDKSKKNVLQLTRNTLNIIQSLKGLGTDRWIDQDLNLLKVNRASKNNTTSMDEPCSLINYEKMLQESQGEESCKTHEESNLKVEEDTLENSENSTEEIQLKKKSFGDENSTSFEEMESNDNENSTSEIISCDSFEKSTSFSSQEWINQVPSQGEIEEDCLKNLELEEAVIVDNEKEDVFLPSKLHREPSVQSNSSLDPIFDLRRPDPVEIFLNLGFGSVPGIDMENCRIPKRFMIPSRCKGGDWNEFLRRELIQAQNFECSSLGFRGLSGPSHRRPSAIVANIMEKLRERSVTQSQTRSTFTEVAKKVMNEKSVLNKLLPDFQSVLSPDNRKFLENQGKISPEVPRRRIIFGQKSFAFAGNGELVEVESRTVPISSEGTPPSNSISEETRSEEDDATNTTLQNDAMYKLRRSSLKKQSKIEEDSDPDDFYVVKKKENPAESNPVFYDSLQCLEKKEKIPRRFLSYSNIKNLNVENNFSETMRSEVEKEIKYLSKKVKMMSGEDLASVLKQVKQLRSTLENSAEA